jgi:hypothetical protein
MWIALADAFMKLVDKLKAIAFLKARVIGPSPFYRWFSPPWPQRAASLKFCPAGPI